MPIVILSNSTPTGNSTTTLQDVVDFTRMYPELEPLVDAAGFSTEKATRIGTRVMAALLAQPFDWKWNRLIYAPFPTISLQQDYAGQGSSLAWISSAAAIDSNNTAPSKPVARIEAVRELPLVSLYASQRPQVCWLPNDQLAYSTWAPNTTFTDPLTVLQNPSNPITQIVDSNGNYQVVTTYGTTGSVAPAWPAAAATAGTQTTDGTVVWTVVAPKGRGIRLGWLPPQSAPVFQINVIGQARPPAFTSLSQTLDPIPDDVAHHFFDGFKAYCWEFTDNPQRFRDEYALWEASLSKATRTDDRERDAAAFYPDQSVMERGGPMTFDIGPAWPFAPFTA